jgi:DNA-directed RNA polymerase subunit RPC12/RpoP
MELETYGGRCPRCGLQMLQKDGGGSSSALAFDACPHCGFAYGTGYLPATGCYGALTSKQVWSAIFRHYGAQNRSELIGKLELSTAEGSPEQTKGIWPSVFAYT